MKLFRIPKIFQSQAPPPQGLHRKIPRLSRNFSAARTGRLFSGWTSEVGPLDQVLRQELSVLRSHSRRLSRDNDYMKAFLRMVRRNVVGPRGVALQVRARESGGELDEAANQKIEQAWSVWGRKGTCSVCGRLSWLDIQRLAITSVARDGEALIREVRGFNNPNRYALQVLDAEWLDHRLNKTLPGNREIRMGVERDEWGRPLAYHFKVNTWPHNQWNPQKMLHERIPANQIIHLFITEDADQTRGVPFSHTAIRRLGMLGGYEEAALTAARAGAAKMGFFQRSESAAASYAPAEQDERGNFIQEAEPGHFEELPDGYEFKEFDPGYPSGEMGSFMKTVLRGAAAGLGVTYNGLANDLEGVNYSSLRAGALEERDEWMVLQNWLIESLHNRVFSDFLSQSMLSGEISLPFAKFDKFNAPQWYPRRWKWVDPDKEGKGHAREVSLGISSLTQIAADQGRDLRDVLEERAAEQELANKMGVTLGDPAKGIGYEPQQETENASTSTNT